MHALIFSAACWAALAWILGPILTPLLQIGADSAGANLHRWLTAGMTAVTQAPSTDTTVVSGFIGWVLQIPLVLFLMLVYAGLGFLAVAFEAVGLFHLFPIVGAYAGVIPGHHSAPFLRAGRSLPLLLGYGYEVASARTASGRLWSAAPLVLLSAGIAWLGLVGMPRLQHQAWWPARHAAATQPVLRYSEQNASWREGDASVAAWQVHLSEATLAGDELEVLVRVRNRRAVDASFRVDPQTALVAMDGSVLAAEQLAAEGLDRSSRHAVGLGYVDVPLHFPRPKIPFRRWSLWLYVGDEPHGGTKIPIHFTLREATGP